MIYEHAYASQQTTDRNEHGCAYVGQTGNDAVQGFTAVIDALPAELRAAFAIERAARSAELAEILVSRTT